MGDEGLYVPNCQTNFSIALYALSLLFSNFINTTACQLCRYKPSSPSTKELYGIGILLNAAGHGFSQNGFVFNYPSKDRQSLLHASSSFSPSLSSSWQSLASELLHPHPTETFEVNGNEMRLFSVDISPPPNGKVPPLITSNSRLARWLHCR